MPLPIHPLPPLVLLPREEWTLRPLNDAQICVGIFSRGGSLYLQKWSIHDFPNAFFGIPDLEDAGLLEVYVRAVDQLINGRASMSGNLAVDVFELDYADPENDGVASTIVALCRKALNLFHAALPSRFIERHGRRTIATKSNG